MECIPVILLQFHLALFCYCNYIPSKSDQDRVVADYQCRLLPMQICKQIQASPELL